MLKFTASNLEKLVTLLEESGYTVRYEKGNFQSGYCIVENKRIAVVNKFFDTEARITVLLEILDRIEISEPSLSEKSAAFLKKIRQAAAPTDQDENPAEPESLPLLENPAA